MGKTKHRTSHISSANPNSISNSQSPNKHTSAILQSSFCPSHFHLSLFASVIRNLDAEHLRLHDTKTGQLRSDTSTGPSTSVTCLNWGFYRHDHPISASKIQDGKKRKRSADVGRTDQGDVVVAYGTKDSEVHFFSPSEAKIVASLRNGHSAGVRDFKFSGDGSSGQAWSIGGDSKLIQWDLNTNQPVRIVSIPTGLANVMQPLSGAVIYASHLAYFFHPGQAGEPSKFNASTNLVRLIVFEKQDQSDGQKFLTAAQNDRFMNVFDTKDTSLIGSLRTEAEVLKADYAAMRPSRSFPTGDALPSEHANTDVSLLAATNSDSVLELFVNPFAFHAAGSLIEASSAKQRLAERTRKSTSQIRFIREAKPRSVMHPLNLMIDGDFITVALVEAGSRLLFESVNWKDQPNASAEILVSQGQNGVPSDQSAGIKGMHHMQADESHAVVSNGIADLNSTADNDRREIIDISSAEEVSDSSADEEPWIPPSAARSSLKNGISRQANDPGSPMETDTRASGSGQTEVPLVSDERSFGERLRLTAPDPIDVEGSFADAVQQTLVPVTDSAVRQLPPGVSLSTVLTQSLRTNDKALLQTCLQIKDMAIVRATIERLESSFAPVLVQRLVERFHSRPGRAGSLMVWIQWTLAAHGGYLTTKPDVLRNLMSLRKVVQERANSLPLLLSLKGKLDLLEAQRDLRDSLQSRVRTPGQASEHRTVYVEGQPESDSDSDQGHDIMEHTLNSLGVSSTLDSRNKGIGLSQNTFPAEGDTDSGGEMPTVNGTLSEAVEDSSGSESEGFFDEEASSTDEDSGEEISDEVDHEDVDTGSSDGAESPPPKRRLKPPTESRG